MILWILDSNMDVWFWVAVCFLQFMQIYNFFFFFLALEQARILMHVITKSLLPYWLQSIKSRLDLYQVSLSIHGYALPVLLNPTTPETMEEWRDDVQTDWWFSLLLVAAEVQIVLFNCALKVFHSFSIALFKFSLPFQLCYRNWFWIQLHKAHKWCN